MSDDIRARAIDVIREHGEAAFLHAAQQADEAMEAADLNRHRLWLSILAQISILERIGAESTVQ